MKEQTTKMKSTNNAYAKMGMAAMLPGMVHMLELMQAEVDNFRTQLAALQGQEAVEGKRHGPRGGAMGWPDDPEERKAEMRRRMAVAKKKRGGLNLSEQRKKAWAALSPAKRRARLAAMAAGKQQPPVVRMAAAS